MIGATALCPAFDGVFGAPQRYGPPFADKELQRVYLTEAQRLADESVFVSVGTAQELVAAVINSALAAAEAAVPGIEARVRREAEAAAKVGVGTVLLGGVAVAALGLSLWGLARR